MEWSPAALDGQNFVLGEGDLADADLDDDLAVLFRRDPDDLPAALQAHLVGGNRSAEEEEHGRKGHSHTDPQNNSTSIIPGRR